MRRLGLVLLKRFLSRFVFLFLYTNHIETLHQKLVDHKVEIAKPLRSESYGKVFVFKDLYGNLWDVIQRN